MFISKKKNLFATFLRNFRPAKNEAHVIAVAVVKNCSIELKKKNAMREKKREIACGCYTSQ